MPGLVPEGDSAMGENWWVEVQFRQDGGDAGMHGVGEGEGKEPDDMERMISPL